jgi:murein DD-endopeptidase MepM/ murein hydrolase activator NlpD
VPVYIGALGRERYVLAQIHNYKRFENSVVQRLKTLVLRLVENLGGVLCTFIDVLNRRYTIVFVPHSEKKVYNLQVTFFSLSFSILFLVGIGGCFVWYISSYGDYRAELAVKDSSLKNVQASLDELRDETSVFLDEANSFRNTLSGVLSSLGVKSKETRGSYQGDLASFFDFHESSDGRLREADDLRNLGAFLVSAVEPLKEIEGLLDSQSSLLTEIPNIWPIKGGIGHISQTFGQNPNPFTGLIYIHKGIDLSTYRQGDPVVATADGQVVTVEYDSGGFGNYIIIRHKHGFYTRYGHLLRASVLAGQRVQQGDIIGTIGNTGLSTGPHLHYEVHIGSDIVDPYKFLNVRNSNIRSPN